MQIDKVVIIGAGTMGRGIAQWFAQNEVKVEITDQSEHQLDLAKENIENSWSKLLEKEKFSSKQVEDFKSQIDYLSIREIDHNADLIIEAIIEDFKAKESLFKLLDGASSPSTIFASNTSSIPIGRLAQTVQESRRNNFLGIHFFNPATIMKLVEIIPHLGTEKALALNFKKWFENKDKQVAISSDSPGFIVNRLARNFYGEAMRIAENADGSFDKIDQVMREIGGFKMGPFELMDLIGIDVNYAVTQSVWKDFYHEPRFAPHALQRMMVENNRLGKKTRRGFYEY